MTKPKVKSILVWPVGNADNALKEAARIAKQTHSRLKIVSVMEDAPAYLRAIAPQHEEIERLARKEKLDELDMWAKSARRLGIRVQSELLTGNPVEAVVRDVLKHGHDLAVVDAEDGGQGCGAAAMRLIRKCPCAVWIARSFKSRGKRRMLAAVDTIPMDKSRAALNSRIAGHAASLASALGAELHVLHVWTAYGETLLGSMYGPNRQQIAAYVDNTKKEHQRELSALVQACRLGLPEARIHLLRGDPSEVIPAFCRSRKIDVLAMGTVARTGVSAAVMGNTAEVVANRVECSLVAIKPEAFAWKLAAKYSPAAAE